MSSLIVEVVSVSDVVPHSNADALDIAIIKGWQTVVKKGTVNKGDTVIYVPPDVLLPDNISEKWGVKKYLGKNGRVLPARLRGEMSLGFIVPVEKINGKIPEIGENVAENLGIEKYEPEYPFNSDMFTVQSPVFFSYTNIENYENFFYWLKCGEEIVATEKIHGTNSRIGKIRNEDESKIVAGTFGNQIADGVDNMYTIPMTENVIEMLNVLYDKYNANSVIIYGEIYGKVQSLRYGCDKSYRYKAFDISVDNTYIDYDQFVNVCNEYHVEMVPLLYRGEFTDDIVKELCEGNTTVGGDHIREGIVIKPTVERRNGGKRVILKKINPDFRLKAHKMSDSH